MSRFEDAIAADEADRALECLRHFDCLIFAVSGGPDSLALLYLAAEWRVRLAPNAPRFYAATVDHQLRPEAAAEAEAVAGHCAKLGIAHVTLTWVGPKPGSGLPDAARRARYHLLEAHARALQPAGRTAVVTAHTEDDQAETIIMRLKRGAGVDGLAAMRFDRELTRGSPVRLVRPLLSTRKARLVATLQARAVAWFDDPTNSNVRYERTRVRTVMPALEAAGLTAASLVLSARRLRDASDGLSYAAIQFRDTLSLSSNNGVYGRFERKTFEAGPAIVRQHVLADLIGHFGGDSPKAELSEIEALTSRLAANATVTATLGGAVVSAGERFVRVWRETGRLSVADLILEPGLKQSWDARFWVSYYGQSQLPVCVKALGREGYAQIAELVAAPHRAPAAAAYGVPAFWTGERLVAVPALAVVTGNGPHIHVESEPIRDEMARR